MDHSGINNGVEESDRHLAVQRSLQLARRLRKYQRQSLGLLEELDSNGLHGGPRSACSRPRCSSTLTEHLCWSFVTLLAQCHIDHATHCAMLQLVLAGYSISRSCLKYETEDRKEDTYDSH